LSSLQCYNANPPHCAAAALALAAVLLAGAFAAASAEEPKTTLEVPTGPVAAEAAEKRAMALARELGVIAEKHGPSAVALQASFLIETIRAGAVGPSEVRVVGESPRQGAEFLEIDVGTGLIFDADTTDRDRCAEQLWTVVVAPVLDKMESFAMEPAGLDLVFGYGLQHFSTHLEPKADLSAPLEARAVHFVIPAKALDDLATDRISIEQLRAAATTVHDGEPVH